MAKNIVFCDTDVMIDYWDINKNRHYDTKHIIDINIGIDNIILSAIVKMELMCGAFNKTDLNKVNKKLQRFNIALLNDAITIKAIELLQQYRLSHQLAIPDCCIAASAIVTKLPLFTYNIKDYRFIKGLELYKP